MRIRNDYDGKIFWRAFRQNDTIYGVGLRQGKIAKDKQGEWHDDSFPKIKIEIKKNGLTGKFLTKPGKRYGMDDDLIVNAKGKLSVAALELSDVSGEEVTRHDFQFVDLRDFNKRMNREVSSSIQNVFSSTDGFQSVASDETTWSVGGKVGGKIKKGKKGEISAGFESKVRNELTASHETTVTDIWTRSWTDKIEFDPRRIHALEIVWTIGMRLGRATYFGEQTTFSVVSSATPSVTAISSFRRPEEMPQPMLQEWTRLHG